MKQDTQASGLVGSTGRCNGRIASRLKPIAEHGVAAAAGHADDAFIGGRRRSGPA